MSFGFRELIVILLIVLIIFGVGKLPSAMHAIGKGVKSFKDGMDGKNHDENNQK